MTTSLKEVETACVCTSKQALLCLVQKTLWFSNESSVLMKFVDCYLHTSKWK